MNIFFIPIIVALIDQLTKLYIKFNFRLYEKYEIFGNFVRIFYIENSGIAFGIDTSSFHFFITVLTIIAIIVLARYLLILHREKSDEKKSISLILGGAIGNCVDRVLVFFPDFGYTGVIDFIDIGFGSMRWYIFNVADMSITFGVMYYLFLLYKDKYYSYGKGNL